MRTCTMARPTKSTTWPVNTSLFPAITMGFTLPPAVQMQR